MVTHWADGAAPATSPLLFVREMTDMTEMEGGLSGWDRAGSNMAEERRAICLNVARMGENQIRRARS